MHHSLGAQPDWRGSIERFMSHDWVQRFLIILIVVNAAIMGIETDPEIMAVIGEPLLLLDHLILWTFIVELVLLMAARRLAFFKDAWSVFDLLVVLIALVPATGSLSVLRALRVLRVLRLINKVESMRTVVGALLGSLPGLGSVFALILIIFYVSAVIATNIYGTAFPDRFGSLAHSFYTLFQVMTLEGWSEEIARPVMAEFPGAWVFFVLFILTATFIVVNLFVAVIVDSINSVKVSREADAEGAQVGEELRQCRAELAEVKQLVQSLKNTLESRS